eukprot:1527783-Pleurochrysis_carterae.AAC.3
MSAKERVERKEAHGHTLAGAIGDEDRGAGREVAEERRMGPIASASMKSTLRANRAALPIPFGRRVWLVLSALA